MEALAIQTGSPTVYWEYNKIYIYVVESKRVTTRFKHIGITDWFLQKKIDNGFFIPKYEKSSVMTSYMCTKPCSGPIISRITKCMTGFRYYPTIVSEHYQLMRLHDFVVN